MLVDESSKFIGLNVISLISFKLLISKKKRYNKCFHTGMIIIITQYQ